MSDPISFEDIMAMQASKEQQDPLKEKLPCPLCAIQDANNSPFYHDNPDPLKYNCNYHAHRP